MELPISHRNTDRAPDSAVRVVVSPGEIQVADETALTLDSGKVSEGDRSGMSLPKLKAKLSSASAARLVVHGATPYATLARVVRTANEAGVRDLYFQVRKPGALTETGWMRLSKVRFTDTVEPPIFETAEMPEWQTFTDVWAESRAGCKEDPRGDCGYVPQVKAEGGKLDMLVRLRGRGISVRFRQYLPEGELAEAPKPKKAAPEMLDGIAAPVPEEEERDPSTEAVFTMRSEAAAQPNSAFSSIVRPVCGDQTCAAAVDAQGVSMAAHWVALLGAAFPDGSPEPRVALLAPGG